MIDFDKYTQFVDAVTSDESKHGGHFQDRLRNLYSNRVLRLLRNLIQDNL